MISDQQLSAALEQVRADGAAHLPRALTDADVHALADECARVSLAQLQEQIGPVHQHAHGAAVTDLGAHPHLDMLRSSLQAQVQGAGVRYRPNEAFVMHYTPGRGGISAHRDHVRYRTLICIFSLQGQSTFSVLSERDGPPRAAYRVVPGDLCLLAAPDLPGAADPRPLHAASGPDGHGRVSLTFRQDAGL